MTFSIRYISAVVIALHAPLLGGSIANAHDSHDSRIQHLEHQISQLPAVEAVELLLQRADLHRRQSVWDAALLDYQSVASLEPNNIDMAFGRAQLHLDQQQFLKAIEWSTRALHLEPAVTYGRFLHARALLGVGDYDSAATVYSSAMNKLINPRPEHFIELAQIVSADLSNPNSQSNAIAILDNGIEELGNLISLNEFAYELELNAEEREAALLRIDKVLSHNGSLLNWRMQRGELLLELGQLTDARAEALCLIYRIQQLPQQRRSTEVFTNLLARSYKLVDRVNMASRDAGITINDSSDLC